MVKNKIALSVLPSIIVVSLLATGFIAGRYFTLMSFDKRMQKAESVFTFGGFLDDDEKLEMVYAYHDTENVLSTMDIFSWAVPNMPTPFVGTAPIPGQHGNSYINSAQFRHEGEISLPKPGNTFRIFLTGGSTAYGSAAPSQDRTIAGYLERALSERLSPVTGLTYEVVSTANPAWASTHERILIENKLSELDPDMIISFSGNNDVHWGFRGRNVLWFRTYSDEYYLGLIKQLYAFTDRPEIPEVTEITDEPVHPEIVSARLYKNVKLSLYALTQESADYVFVLQPTLAATNKQLTVRERNKIKQDSLDYFRTCYEQIDTSLGNIDASNFSYVNLTGIFDEFGNQEDIFLDSYHFGDKGNEIIAGNIFQHVKDIVISR